jgi:arylsulfatase A-like enzyme
VAPDASPRNLVVLLLDSLNRHMLGSYGGTEFDTPNLDAFAARAVRFTSHVTGSLPCMPARHDILCGALDFLWRPWGSIEIWEEPITAQLRRAGVTTMLVSDHPHLFETGGENYHADFTAWDYVRGHESDPWRTFVDPSFVGAPALPARSGAWYWQRLGMTGALDRPYDQSRTFFRSEADYPGPRTMHTAAEWLRRGAPTAEPFLLFVDEFDPHEPFDTPEPWAGCYDPDWEGDLVIWPPYDVGAVAAGRLSAREGRQIRANYGAKLSMIDHWVGRIFDALTERDLWESTAVVICTDHGHYLGE